MDIDKAEYKSQTTQFVLTLCFGPFGLFYSNKVLAVIGSTIAIAMLGAFFFGTFITWPPSMALGYFCVQAHNQTANRLIKFREKRDAHLAKSAT